MNSARKPIFDAVRALARPGLFTDPGNILALDNLLDAFDVPRDDHSDYILGTLSEKFESGGRGAGTVSTGVADPGGVSYGIWQLASKTGTAAAFMTAEGRPWRDEFGGQQPGSVAFTAAWKSVATREEAKFTEAQRAFIKRTHYEPAVKAVSTATGLNLDACHNAVRDATWSVSVQHGRAAQILIDAVKRCADRSDPRKLVNAIYDARIDYVQGIAAHATPANRKTLLSVVANRYPAERAAALKMVS